MLRSLVQCNFRAYQSSGNYAFFYAEFNDRKHWNDCRSSNLSYSYLVLGCK